MPRRHGGGSYLAFKRLLVYIPLPIKGFSPRISAKDTFSMTPAANGITAEVIRDVMLPYQLNTDLLGAMLAAVPPPPAGAATA